MPVQVNPCYCGAVSTAERPWAKAHSVPWLFEGLKARASTVLRFARKKKPPGRGQPARQMRGRSNGLFLADKIGGLDRELVDALENPVNFGLRNGGGGSVDLLTEHDFDAAVI
jgi:hypothetical protein